MRRLCEDTCGEGESLSRKREPVLIERDAGIGIITIENPPVNALSQAVRQGLLAALEELDADRAMRAIVLHGVGRDFIAGADVRELECPAEQPLLNDVLLRLEASGKPVIAALHGATLGGGAETALASHYRCGTSDLQLGFPEVTLGLLPGAGGTVRLPRLVGVRIALDMMTSGAPIRIERACELGLVDRRIEGDIREEAVAYAHELVAAGAGTRPSRERTVPDAQSVSAAFFRDYQAALPRAIRKLAAAECVVQSVEAAATRPFDGALALARALFETCRASPESAALRHLFFAERGSASARESSRTVRSVGVIGAGTMGAGIAASFAQAGFEVLLTDASAVALDAGLERLRSSLDSAAGKGRISPEAATAAWRRVRGATLIESLGDSDLIIEAVFEDLRLKCELFGQLGRVCKPGAVLATNTSTLDVEAITAASRRPADGAGMHFFSPANVMRLVEIVGSRASSRETLATLAGVTRRIGKVGVIVGNGFGFVGNRMLYAYGREKELMLLEGATPERIDRALESFGMAMGPNAVGDLAGLDIGAHARAQWQQRPDDPRFYRVSDLLVEQGRLGRKSGRGFYDYSGPSLQRKSDPEVTELIRLEARRLGVRERAVSDQEIVERSVFALINEGARILEEGIAARAADIDVIWCNGYGFPRACGGPMFYADTVGLPRVLAAIEKYGSEQGARYWTPAPLLRSLAAAGRRLRDW